MYIKKTIPYDEDGLNIILNGDLDSQFFLDHRQNIHAVI